MDASDQMTSSTAAAENIILSTPDPKAKLRRRRAEFWQICSLVTLASLLISLSAVLLAQRLAPAASQHDLDQAALAIASELGSLTVKHQRLGQLGLLDFSDDKRSQIAFNSLEAILRVDGMAARQLELEPMYQCLSNDADAASHLARELARLERELASPKAPAQLLGRESFTSVVRKVLSQSGAGGRLRSLKISLGALKNSKFGSRTPLPAVAGEENESYANGHEYRTHVNVPIWSKNNFQFYETADSARLAPVSQFVEVAENELASVLLIEASFEVAERGQLRHIQKMQSCAIVGAPALKRPSSVFMLSFPQGYLSSIRCFKDIFSPGTYTGTDGEWLKAVDGDVPGAGFMATASDELAIMPPQTAAINALYHYMFNVGPGLVPENLITLMKEPIASIQVNGENDSASSLYNSALFKDTRAARFALVRQSQSGGAGQIALRNAFSNKRMSELMPAFAFPLLVDSHGSLSLVQENSFDQERLSEFLNALYLTNIAGIESMQIADTVAKRMTSSIYQSENKIASIEEEMQSVKKSLELLQSKSISDAQREKQRQPLMLQIEEFKKQIKDEQDRKAGWEKIKTRANLVGHNARQAARSTYEIGAHMSSFVSQGLKKISAPVYGFLLGKYVVFTPCTTPVDEDDLYEPSGNGKDTVYMRDFTSEWLKADFKVTSQADKKMFVDDRPISDYWQMPAQKPSNKPLYLLLTSHELLNSKTPSLFASRLSPFDNAAISKSQLCYFAPQSILTGSATKVGWSVLLRDLVYSYVGGQALPTQSLRPRWCLDLGMDEETCPGLSVEMQIRTPIPKIEGSLPGSYLQDPEGGPSVALYPPLPPELI